MSAAQFNAGILGAFLALALVCVIAWIVAEVRKPPRKKPNVRLPRETLWTRTNRYHQRPGDSQQLVMHDLKDWPGIMQRQAD